MGAQAPAYHGSRAHSYWDLATDPYCHPVRLWRWRLVETAAGAGSSRTFLLCPPQPTASRQELVLLAQATRVVLSLVVISSHLLEIRHGGD